MIPRTDRKVGVSGVALLLLASYLASLPTLASANKPPGRADGQPAPPAPLESTPNGWVTITTEDFEGAFPSGKWTVWHDPTWDDDEYRPHGGAKSAWCASGGAHGRDPASNEYANNMDAWMEYGPFDLSDASSAELSFYAWYETEPNYDPWVLRASPDDLRTGPPSGGTAGRHPFRLLQRGRRRLVVSWQPHTSHDRPVQGWFGCGPRPIRCAHSC